MNTDKNTKSIIVAAVIALLGTSYAVAETSQVDPATGNTLHLSGNALPDEGQSRPLFHVTQMLQAVRLVCHGSGKTFLWL